MCGDGVVVGCGIDGVRSASGDLVIVNGTVGDVVAGVRCVVVVALCWCLRGCC